MTPLRQRMTQDMQIRNLSPRTIECYIYHVGCFAKHFGRSPDRIGPEEVRAYQVYLVQQKKASWASFNQAVCALRFLYRVTLPRPWPVIAPSGSLLRSIVRMTPLRQRMIDDMQIRNLSPRTIECSRSEILVHCKPGTDAYATCRAVAVAARIVRRFRCAAGVALPSVAPHPSRTARPAGSTQPAPPAVSVGRTRRESVAPRPPL
jgi:hypothetical protein